MAALLIFIAYLVMALISGAAIAYPMHAFLTNWLDVDFERVTSRCVLLAAIVLFVVLYKKLNIFTWRDIGYNTGNRQFCSDVVKGVRLGILIMCPVAVGLLITNNRIIYPDLELSATYIFYALASGLVSGLIIAVVEETLFRGAMLSAVKRQSTASIAIVSTSSIYALVHFIQPESGFQLNSLDWASGFLVLQNALTEVADIHKIMDSLIALFLAGVLLSIVRLRTNRIAFCIGIHAGWVLIIKLLKRMTYSNTDSDYAFLTGSYDKVTGYLTVVVIIAFIVSFLRPQKKAYNKQVDCS